MFVKSITRHWHLAPRSASIGRICQLSPTSVPPPCSLRRQHSSIVERLPRVVQPKFWLSMIPKFMRPTKDTFSISRIRSKRSKEWNPATFYIWIFLLIGSNGINLIALKSDYATFSRKSDAKIALLKEVLERVQRGEDVDVEKMLGTGNDQHEQEWKDVLQDIEEDENIGKSKARRKEKRQSGKSVDDASSTSSTAFAPVANDVEYEPLSTPVKTYRRPPKFY